MKTSAKRIKGFSLSLPQQHRMLLFTISLLLLLTMGLSLSHAARDISATNTIIAVTNTNDAGAGSLRAAITLANSTTGADVINFAIGTGPETINLQSPLPTITETLTIDATTQPGYNGSPIIELNGTNAGVANGLTINASGCVAQGLVINHFNGHGISISMNSNVIAGNFIGTDITGTIGLGNSGNGILINGASNNRIGGTAVGQGNIIAFSTLNGVLVNAASVYNSILGNSIFSNGQLGIDLDGDGVTPNDSCDTDYCGANILQNFPLITLVNSGDGNTNIRGTFNSWVFGQYRLEFYSSPACNGEGQTFLGSINITTGTDCVTNINVTLPVSVAATSVVTSTATDQYGNTSEFSPCFNEVAPFLITCPANLALNASPTQCGAVVNYPAPPEGMGSNAVTCVPPAGALFPVGTTIVDCASRSGAICSFAIEVRDNIPPIISCSQNISITTASGAQNAIVNYPPATATDACGRANATCAPPSGTTFPIGITAVNCSATDESNNSSICIFVVTVTDGEAPHIQCPNNITVDAAVGQTSALVNYSAPAITDNSPGAVVTCAPPSGSAFPLGITAVNCNAADSAGNQANCGFSVTVNGGTPTAKITIPGNKSAIEFGSDKPVKIKKKPVKNKKLTCEPFTIENTGFTPLVLTLESINRIGSDVDSRIITDMKESVFYSLSELNSDGTETLIPVGSTVTIKVGEQKSFCLRFNPTIPGVATNTNSLSATQVVPDPLSSRVTFRLADGSTAVINVISNLETTLKLINPDNPQKDAVIKLSRSGNEFTVTFSVFDSNQDVSRVKYEFLTASGEVVDDPIEVDLTQVLKEKKLVRGQSFTVIQPFTGANSHAEVTGVRVTVFDSESSVTASVNNVLSASHVAQADSRAAVISLPTVRLKGLAPR